MDTMKNKIIITGLAAFLAFLTSCEDTPILPVVEDNVAPGKVENINVTPIPGGLKINYNLPSDKDLLYVQAEYERNEGVINDARASIYMNEVTILGFADTLPKTVNLYAVDRSLNKSEAVQFTETPLEAPLTSIMKSIEIKPDYGGAKFTWDNPTRASIAVILYAEDSTGILQKVETAYSSMIEGRFSIRGYEPEPTKFKAIIRDRWNHYSEDAYPNSPDSTIIPLYEERLDKTKFNKVVLPNDDNWDAWAGQYERLYDDKFTTIVHTLGDHALPSIYSIDLGVNVKLSRIKVYERMDVDHFAFTHGAPKNMDVYGALSLGDESGDLEDWIKLREECVSIKPSELPIGKWSDEDLEHRARGDEFSFEDPIEIRYFRLAVTKTWDGAGYVTFSEVTWWGDVVE